MRLVCAFVLAMGLAGCGGVEPGSPALPPVDAGPDGIPGAGSHATDLAGEPAPSPGPGGGLTPLYMPCSKGTDCQSGVCGSYPGKGGMFCTNNCDSTNGAAQCPPPGTGCNHMGVCKF